MKENRAMLSSSFNEVTINLRNLRDNFKSIQQAVASQVRIMAVVKSDAYGHGMVESARSLAAAGAKTFGVAEVEEGVALREADVAGEIVVLLGPGPGNVGEIVQHRLTPVLFTLEGVDALSATAKERGEDVGVHVKVDVGMGRLGIMPDELISFCRKIEEMPGIHVAGLVSHLPMAEDTVSGVTVRQIEHFHEIVKQLQGEFSSRLICHIANSAALLGTSDAHCNMVRPGISLYGCYPEGLALENVSVKVHPVMSFTTRVLQVKEVPAGYGISYGHMFVTDRPSKIAVLPIGYDDGYLRRLSNRAEVLIHGRRAPVRGRICMNACMVDITDFDDGENINVGDEVVLMGCQQQERITPEEVAGWMETITYEVFCLFGSMNQRRYI